MVKGFDAMVEILSFKLVLFDLCFIIDYQGEKKWLIKYREVQVNVVKNIF